MQVSVPAAPSVTVDAGYVQARLARIGALMAAVIGFVCLVQLVLGDDGMEEIQRPSDWVAIASGLCWATLWLVCKYVPMRPSWLRIVEAACIGGAVTALALVARLSPVEAFIDLDGPEVGNDVALSLRLFLAQRLSSLSVLIATALAMVARAALVPTSPRHTLVLTGGVGVPLILVWFFDINWFALGAELVLPQLYVSQGVKPGWTIATVACIWWSITTVVCYVISRVVHGLSVQVVAARKLGEYTLLEKLGEGGMGEVYRARHSRLRRPTAVKLLPTPKSSEQAVARFEAEVQLTAELTHPNTITIFDYGRTDDGVFYYAMEYLKGVTLEQVVRMDGPQPAARVIKILEQAAGALQEAHGAGVIHRDIKPANIMLTRQGIDPDATKVLDFGLVRVIERPAGSGVTQEGSVLGTPLYMAPESIRSADVVGPLSDIYSLGAVGYFLLTGSHPFSGGNLLELCAHHLYTEPQSPSSRLGRPVAEDLEATILQCLAKLPADRPEGAAGLTALLQRCQDHGSWSNEDGEAWWVKNQDVVSGLDPADGAALAVQSTQALTVA